MKLICGKWHIALRFTNDFCIALGRPSADLRSQADRNRNHWGI